MAEIGKFSGTKLKIFRNEVDAAELSVPAFGMQVEYKSIFSVRE
jgi:hypothetical protein